MFLTRKSVSFILDNKETFDTVTLHCTKHFALQKTENSILLTATYT